MSLERTALVNQSPLIVLLLLRKYLRSINFPSRSVGQYEGIMLNSRSYCFSKFTMFVMFDWLSSALLLPNALTPLMFWLHFIISVRFTVTSTIATGEVHTNNILKTALIRIWLYRYSIRFTGSRRSCVVTVLSTASRWRNGIPNST